VTRCTFAYIHILSHTALVCLKYYRLKHLSPCFHGRSPRVSPPSGAACGPGISSTGLGGHCSSVPRPPVPLGVGLGGDGEPRGERQSRLPAARPRALPSAGPCTALHCTALHCTAPCRTLGLLCSLTMFGLRRHNNGWVYCRNRIHPQSVHCTALHCTALHCTALRWSLSIKPEIRITHIRITSGYSDIQ
jgi:hypothetical protein